METIKGGMLIIGKGMINGILTGTFNALKDGARWLKEETERLESQVKRT